MLSVSEATDWSVRTGAQSKYKALRCGIHHLPESSPEFENVCQHVVDSITEWVFSLCVFELGFFFKIFPTTDV